MNTHNRRQNELRHFALNWAFLRFTDFKRRKYSFSSPIPSIHCCADVRATFRKQQTPQLWTEGRGEGCGFFCSPKLPYLSTMSQQVCSRLYKANVQEYSPGEFRCHDDKYDQLLTWWRMLSEGSHEDVFETGVLMLGWVPFAVFPHFFLFEEFLPSKTWLQICLCV